MEMRDVRFADRGDLVITILPAIPKLNPIYRACAHVRLTPLALAYAVGRVSEETALDAIATVYAESVINGSSDPALADLDTAGWKRWLLAHPAEFTILRELAPDLKTWEMGSHSVGVLPAAEPAGGG